MKETEKAKYRQPASVSSAELSKRLVTDGSRDVVPLRKQIGALLLADAKSWRRRKYRSLITTLVSTLFISTLLWSSQRVVRFLNDQQASSSSQSPVVDVTSLGIPSCTNDVFMDPETCYTVIYAPNTTEFGVVVGRLGVAGEEVRGFASGVDMDAFLYAHPNTVLAAVEFFKESATRYAFSVQTNGTARWFKGSFYSRDDYVQLPVIAGVQRAMSRFLDDKKMEIGLRVVGTAMDGADDGGVGGTGGSGSVVGGSDVLLPLFYISSSILILMMQVHDTVEKHGVIDVLVVHSLSRSAHYCALVATWSGLCFWNSVVFVGTYACLHARNPARLTWYDVSLMMSGGQAMMAMGLVVGASVRRKGSVLGVGFLLFFWSWLSMVGRVGGLFTEYWTPWGLLVVGLGGAWGNGGWAVQVMMLLLGWGYMLAGWAISVRVWRWFGGTDVGDKIDDGKGGKASKAVVKVEHIRRRFGRTVALEDVSLELAAGQEKAVLGTCSAGKSTLIKSILDERCPYVRRTRGTTVGYCPQEPQLLAHLTVEEWLGLVRAIRGIPEDPGDDTADSADADDGDAAADDGDANANANADTERDNRVIWELNAGERRWVALLTATIGSTLVLLDEPTSEMSPKLRRMAWKKIQELKQRGVSVLIATHDVDEAERADEILVLSRGISVFTGTELELRRRFGCGYMLNIRVSGTMADNVRSLVTKTLGTKEGKVTSADGYCTFDVPHEMEDRLPRLLTTLDMNKSLFGVEDVQLRAATIANSFMTLIKQVEQEAAVREGRYELLLVAEEGIALKIPIGSDLVESPSGSLYSVAWGTDPSTGRLTITNYDRALYY